MYKFNRILDIVESLSLPLREHQLTDKQREFVLDRLNKALAPLGVELKAKVKVIPKDVVNQNVEIK